jgi:hypothetical protein
MINELAPLSITVALRNSGMSRLPLNENMKMVRVLGLVCDVNAGPGIADWERVTTLPILTNHAWLEAQESVTDTILFRLDRCDRTDRCHEAYQVEAIVGAPRRFISGKGIRWRSRAVVFSSPVSSKDDSKYRRVAAYLAGINGFSKRPTNREMGIKDE